MITLLIAGHETTSGTMSFLFYHFLKNPEKMWKAQQEVDEVLGRGPLEASHLPKLKYVDACIKEALRFQGPIAGVARRPKGPQLLGGKYYVDEKTAIVVSLALLHKDRAVWGDDVGLFKPERMLDMSKIPAGAWRPFGIGARSCIGRAFAEQEMIAAVALILQRFQIEMADPSYDLKLHSTLTIKPDDFKFKVRRRPDFKGPIVTLPGASITEEKTRQPKRKVEGATDSVVSVLYGEFSLHLLFVYERYMLTVCLKVQMPALAKHLPMRSMLQRQPPVFVPRSKLLMKLPKMSGKAQSSLSFQATRGSRLIMRRSLSPGLNRRRAILSI